MVQCEGLATRRGAASLLLLWVAIGLAGSAIAHESPPVPTTTQHEPSPIAVAAILARADTDERFAEGVSRRKEAPDPIDRLSPQLETLSRSVDEMLAVQKPEKLRQLPVMRLESLARHWRFDAGRFEVWEEDMRQAMTSYAIDSAELARRRGQWEATRTAGESVPESFAERVADVIARLRQAEADLSAPLARQIELRQRANAVNARLQTGQN